MLLEIHPDNPQARKIEQVLKVLKNGGVIIYPTDTVYGLGCDITQPRAIERICRIKGIQPKKANLSFICADLSDISNYCRPYSTSIYKLMKSALPGPFTFILEGNSSLPKLLKNRKKTLGVRVPNSPIVRDLVLGLGQPLLSSSIKNLDEEDEIREYPTDPYEIHEQYEHLVDLVIDGGMGGHQPSTVVDCTQNPPELIRQGLGKLNF